MPPASNDLRYFKIDDFSPGIVTDAGPSSVGFFGLDLPPGSASDAVNAMSTPTGQLVGITGGPGSTHVTAAFPGTIPYFVGLKAVGGAYKNGVSMDLLVVGLQSDNGGAGPYASKLSLYLVDPNLGINTAVVVASDSQLSATTYPDADQAGGDSPNIGSVGPNKLHGMSFAFARARGSAFTSPGNPCVFTEWAEYLAYVVNGKQVAIWQTPDPTAPGTAFKKTAYTVNQPNSDSVIFFTHNGRVLALNNIGYTWSTYQFRTNEVISYTDPPGNYVLNTPTTVLDPDLPSGYGSWGSLTYGEALLVKHVGGAIQVVGDIYAPSITRLPGVAPTHGVVSPAMMTSRGLIYLTRFGAYIWSGGQASTKISRQDDTFFLPPVKFPQGLTCSATRWGQFTVYPNGWVFDEIVGSWWKMDQSAVKTPYTPSGDGIAIASAGGPFLVNDNLAQGPYLYAVPAMAPGTTGFDIFYWTLGYSGGNFSWQSQFLPLSPNRFVNIREVIVEVSAASGSQLDVYIQDLGNVSQHVGVVTVSGNATHAVRFPCGVKCYKPSVKIAITTAGGTDIVNSIALGWEEAEPIAQT